MTFYKTMGGEGLVGEVMEEALLHFLCFSVFSSSDHLTRYSIVVNKPQLFDRKEHTVPSLGTREIRKFESYQIY
jgi:hypothetical protein